MITAQEIRELAEFWTDEGDALSLYFEPSKPPAALNHHEEPVLAKERIQEAVGSLQGLGPSSRGYIRRFIESIAEMDGNHRRARVIFACGRRNIWREYDLAGKFGVRADVAPSFSIAPLMAQQENGHRYGIALADRNRSRIFILEDGELTERGAFPAEEAAKIRTTGARKSVHLERQKQERVRQHIASLCEHLLRLRQRRAFDALLIGCRQEIWAELEAALPSDLKRILVAHFRIDPGLASAADVQEKAEEAIAQCDREELQNLANTVAGAAASGALGAVGLPSVIQALEEGEARTLLWPDSRTWFERGASFCPNCGHLDLNQTVACALCGNRTRWFARAHEALVRKALAQRVEIRALRHATLHPADEIAAWLRFRAQPEAAMVG